MKHLLFLFPFALSAAIPCFRPPECWQHTDPTKHSSVIRAAFVAPIKRGFAPSITLALEETDLSPEDYLKAVEKQYAKNRSRTYRQTGTLSTPAGTAYLAHIENTSPPQATTSLQSIVVTDKTAYIMTGTAKSSDFPKCRRRFLEAFSSFSLLDDVLDFIPDKKRRAALVSQTGDLTTYLENNHREEGAYWQLLFLAKVKESELDKIDALIEK